MGLKFIVKDKNLRNIIMANSYFMTHIRFMRVVSLWPLDLWSNEAVVKWTTRIWQTIWQLISIHLNVLHILTLRNRMSKGGTLDDVSGILMSTMVYGFTFFIIIFFQMRHKSIRQLIDFLNNNLRSRSAYGHTYLTIEPSFRSMDRKVKLWIFVCLSGTWHYSLTPILTGQKVLPLDIDYPFATDISPRYEVLYILQVLGQIQVGVSFSTSGGLFMCAVILVSGQFDMLFCSLKNLRSTAMILKGDYKAVKILQNLYNPETEEQSQYENGVESTEDLELIQGATESDELDNLTVDRSRDNNSPIRTLNLKPKDNYLLEYRDELHIALVDCIRHHQIIKEMAELIEDTYYTFSFVKLFQISFLMCFLTYIVSRTTEINMQVVNLVEYLSLVALELLLFCYFGELISRQSVRISEAARRSPWYLCNGSFRRTLLIMMSCAVKPLRLTAGKFSILNIETFRSVFTASFSYYTLLKNIGEH